MGAILPKVLSRFFSSACVLEAFFSECAVRPLDLVVAVAIKIGLIVRREIEAVGILSCACESEAGKRVDGFLRAMEVDLVVEAKICAKVMRVRESTLGRYLRCSVYPRLPFREGY